MRLPPLWLLASCFFFLNNINSQSLNWGRSLGNAQVHASAQFSNGDILIAGKFKDSLRLENTAPLFLTPPNKTHGFFARLDTNGAVVWSQPLQGEMVKVQSVSLGTGDSIILGGSFTANVDLDPSSLSFNLQTKDPVKTEVFIAKYDSSGNFVNGGNFRCPQNQLQFSLKDHVNVVTNSIDNSIIMAIPLFGTSPIDLDPGPDSVWYYGNSLAGSSSVALIGLDKQLNYSWHKVIDSKGGVNHYDLNINSDGDIHIIGSTDGSLELDANNQGPELIASGNKFFWLSLSGSGNFQWIHDFGTAHYNFSNKTEVIDPVSGSCYILASFTNGTIDLDRSNNSYFISGNSSNSTNDFIAKFDKDGQVQWGFVVDDNIAPRSLTVNEDNVMIGGGYRFTSDFNHGIKDSLVTNNSTSRENPFIATYDSQGQFLSVFTLSSGSNHNTHIDAVFSLPASSSIIAMPGANGSSVIDLDPDTLSTTNIDIFQTNGKGIASYSFPCLPATALSRDSFPSHYDYCANEWADLYLPTRASGYSQINWEADTGTGFYNLDSMQVKYQLRHDNLRVLTKNELDTTLYRAIISNDCGMDTTETVSLYVRPSQMDTVIHKLCREDTININGTDYYYEAAITDSAANTYGCDSVTFHKIEKISTNSFIYHQGGALITTSDADSVQWISCSNFQAVTGANDTIFYPSDTNKYAVIIYKNGCTDTSDCSRSTVALPENDLKNQILVYPNPSNGKIYMQHVLGIPLSCKIRNIQGQLLDEVEFNASEKTIHSNSSGMIIIEFYTDEGVLLDQKKLMILPD